VRYPDDPGYVNGSGTSKESAEKLVPSVHALREMVYSIIAAHPDGITDERLDIITDRDRGGETLRPRRIELTKKRHGQRVVDSGRTEKNRSGKRATLWVVRKRTIPRQELNGD
jgi:hypothetical protein